MALTRRMLKAMGIEEEKVDEIISAHSETVDALKDQRDKYKEDAEKLPNVQKDLDKAKEDLKKAKESGGNGETVAKEDFEKLQKDFDDYKKGVEGKETRAAKEKAYRDLLKSANVSEKRINAVLKVSDIDSIELDKEGKIKDVDKLTENVKKEWADFIEEDGQQGASTETPPGGNSGKEVDYSNMSMEEYIAARTKK